MNIVKIIRNLKFLRILMKKYVADDQMQYDIRHNSKNVIDLDVLSEEDEPENSNNSEIEVDKKAEEDDQAQSVEMASMLNSQQVLIHENTD